MRNNKNRIVEIEIVSLSKKGNGLGFFTQPDGTIMQAEIPFTAPGDKVRALLLRKRGGVFSGKLEEVITSSPERITPKCVHFGVCGGCRLQHISYENQLQYKESHVRKCFTNLDKQENDIRPIFACSSPWNYRNKMEYSFSSDLAGNKYLGLSMDSSNGKVFNMVECHLTNPWFIDALTGVKRWWEGSDLEAYRGGRDAGSLRTLTLREGRRTGDRMVILTVSGNPNFALRKHHIDSFTTFVREAVEPTNTDSKLSIFLRIQQIGKGMPTNIYEMLLYGPDHFREILHLKIAADQEPINLTFHVSPSAFFQTNTVQAEQLYSLALSMAKIPNNASVYDLYCGTGVLGICISQQAKDVVGIELSPESALDARTNAKLNGCNNVTIISGAVRNVLNQLPQLKLPHPDVLIVNPPRPGLDPEAIRHLIKFDAPKIIYISCNSITQAVDIEGLLPHGYQIESVQPIDQFPQTYHVENIVVLTKIK